MKIDIASKTLEELKNEFAEAGEKPFRAGQVFSWLHKKNATSFEEMSDISKNLRSFLSEKYIIYSCAIEKKLKSEYDGSIKYLFKLNDGEYIESVLMKYKYGYTVCVSTQVGCKMGCNFCATAQGGFQRNLLPSEILSQIYVIQKDTDIRVSHVVLMGMGEPLDNYENVLRFLELVNSPDGNNLSMRNISLSTCGIVPKIYDLAEKKLQLTLSVSLHAPDDDIRSGMMPVNKAYPIAELIKACKYYIKLTSRRISFEYAMVNGVNDSDECANMLSKLLKGMLCHVNLIPVNNVVENSYSKSSAKRIEAFSRILEKHGITTTVRRSLGSDIDASCGQLRRRVTSGKEEQS